MHFFIGRLLREVLKQYEAHYHTERNHQGLNNRLIDPGVEVERGTGEMRCRERLGGVLKFYYRDAA